MLKARLKSVRISVTKLANSMTNDCADDSLDIDVLRVKLCESATLFERMHSINKEREKELEAQLVESPNNGDILREMSVEAEKMEEYTTALEHAVAVANTRIKSEDDSGESVKSCHDNHKSVRLPKIILPIFSGDILEWQQFFESFNAAVHESNVSPIEKFTYLRGQLRGEALATVTGLSLTNKNYDVALALLEERFGNENMCIRAHVNELLNIDIISKIEYKPLRSLLDKIHVHIRCLESLEVATEKYGLFLTEIVLARLPKRLRGDYGKLPLEYQTMEGLLKLLEAEVKSMELVKSTESATPNETQYKVKGQSFAKPHNQTFMAKSDLTKCSIYYVEGHKTFRCPQLNSCTSTSEKTDLIKSKRLCFNCFGPHRVRDCQSSRRCNKCQRSHHTVLHIDAPSGSTRQEQVTSSNNVNVLTSKTKECHSVMPIVPMNFVCSKLGTIQLGGLLDSGSDNSFILSNILKKIRYKVVGRKQLTITGFHGLQTCGNFDVVECCAITKNGKKLLRFIVVKELGCVQSATDLALEEIVVSSGERVTVNAEPVSALIGNDNFYKVATGEVEVLQEGLAAMNTSCGWILHGSVSSPFPNSTCALSVNSTSIPFMELQRYWEIENSGTTDVSGEIRDDLLVMSHFQQNLSRSSDGRYSVGFPWKSSCIQWSTYEMDAKLRLFGVVRRLIRLGKLQEYDKIINNYIKEDIAEEIPPVPSSTRVRVLPHHAVFKEQSQSTKVRVVLDASAKCGSDDLSINDCMHEGSNLLPNVVGILPRFRAYAFAMTADVEKAFLQVGLQETDRNAVRYWWYKQNLNNTFPAETPILFRMKRLPFGITASPFLLCATIRHHCQMNSKKYPEATTLVMRNMYMDDLIVSIDSPSNLCRIKQDAINIFNDMKMNLTKWSDNLKPETHSNTSACTSVLGMQWQHNRDTLSIGKFTRPKCVTTKRELASLVCSIWDPLGYFSPIFVTFKLLLQETWRTHLDWDEDLGEDVQRNIQRKLLDVAKVCKHEIPRCVSITGTSQHYHVFCDASLQAYGACLYLVNLDGSNRVISSHLLISRVRLAPLKGMTIPRLELLATLTGARLYHFVKSNLNFDASVTAWSDSQVALHWVKNTHKTWKQFVQNRVVEVRELLPPRHWNYVATRQNPADLFTRDANLLEICDCKLWWHGPMYFETFQQCPTQSYSPLTTPNDVDLEEKLTTHITNVSKACLDITRYSSWMKAVRVVVYVIRFINKITKRKSNPSSIIVEELQYAETLILKMEQQRALSKELTDLAEQHSLSKYSSIYKLNPFIGSDGLLRVNTRLQNSFLTNDEIFPVIVPHSSHAAKLIALHFHTMLLHAGVSTVVAEVRKRYWIIRARRTIKVALHQCLICRRSSAAHVQERWAPLPKERVECSKFCAFLYTGLDYLGPIHIVSGKVYVLLLTCLRVRAIHLEVTTSLESSDFVDAFSRFVSRRGTPKVLYSDNAKTFKGAESTVSGTFRLTWKYITERAPHNKAEPGNVLCVV